MARLSPHLPWLSSIVAAAGVAACAPQIVPATLPVPSATANTATPAPGTIPPGMDGVQDPRGLAVDANGNAWLVNGAPGDDPAGRVLRFSSAGALLGRYDLGAEGGPAICDASGSLWTLSSSPSLALFEISPQGATRSFPILASVSSVSAHGMAIDPAGGIWISDADHGLVLRCLDGALDREIALPADSDGVPARPWALAASSESVWVASRGGRQVFRIGLTSSATASCPLNSPGTGAIALDANGFVYAGTFFKAGGSLALTKLQASGSIVREYDFSQAEPNGLAGDARGYLWGLDWALSRVIRLTPGDGGMKVYSNQSVVRPALLATDPTGNAWVASPATPGSTGSLYMVPAEP